MPGASGAAGSLGGAGAVEVVEDGPVAPVADVEEQPAIPPAGLGGHQQGEVGREADTALRVRGSEANVRDGRVDPRGRVDGEVRDAPQLPVGAGIAEGLPVRVGGVGRYFEMGQRHRCSLLLVLRVSLLTRKIRPRHARTLHSLDGPPIPIPRRSRLVQPTQTAGNPAPSLASPQQTMCPRHHR